MKDENKTKSELIIELREARQKVHELESSELERVGIEKSLKDSELKWRLILKSIPSFVAEIDLDGIILSLNKVQPGLSLENYIGKSIFDILAPESRYKFKSAFSQVIKKYTSIEYEASDVGPNRTTARYHHHLAPVIENGKIRSLIIVVNDITERKRAEEGMKGLQTTILKITAMNDLHIVLQTIIEQAAKLLNADISGLYLCEQAKKQVRLVAACNIPSDYIGTTIKYGEGAAGKVADTGKPLIVDDYRIWDGRAVVYEEAQPFTAVLCVPMKWKDQVIGVINIIDIMEGRCFTQSDLEMLALFADHAVIAVENSRLYEQAQKEIIERKQAEEEIQKQKKFLEATFNSVTHPFYVIDVNDYSIILANQATRVYDVTKPTKCYTLTHKRDKPCTGEHFCPLEEVKKTKKPVKTEHIHYDKYGNVRYVDLHGYPIFDDKGNVTKMIEYTFDITERKKMEKSLQKAHDELEERVEERTAELIAAQEQIIRSERLAATGQLAASIAHEINSPLQAITMLLGMIKRENEENKELLNNIDLLKGAFFNIRNTVNNLMDLNRPGKERKQMINVNAIIKNTAALMKSHLTKNKVKIDLDLSSDVPDMIASPQQLGHVFLNLINNSVEAMLGVLKSEGKWKERAKIGGDISIKTRFEKDHIVIYVSDNGPGIAEEDLEHIFDPFYTRKKTMGMGVGLSVCIGIIEDHNGTIEVRNAKDGGAVFIVTLLLKTSGMKVS